MASEPKLIKVCLTNRGDDTETPWAHDLGPAPASAPPGSRKVKLVNVPFMHAKPTWGDVIIVSPAANTFPTWDRAGVPWKQIASCLVEDCGRWAMIVDYAPRSLAADEAFAALSRACDGHKIVCEGAWAPHDGDPGRVYLAVQRELTADDVMARLGAAHLPVTLIQIHPEPKRVRAQTEVGLTAEPPRRPAPTVKPSADPVAPQAVSTTVGIPATRPPARAVVAAPLASRPTAKATSVAKAKPSPAKPARAAKPAPAAKQARAAKPAVSAKPAPAAKQARAPKPAKVASKKRPATKKPANKPANKPASKR